MNQKLIIHGVGLRSTHTFDQMAPSDRPETLTITGNMRSPSDGFHTFWDGHTPAAVLNRLKTL